MLDIRLVDELGNETVVFQYKGGLGEINIIPEVLLYDVAQGLRAHRAHGNTVRVRLVHTHPYETMNIETGDGKNLIKTAPLSIEDIELVNELRRLAPHLNFQIVAIVGINPAFLSRVTYPAR